MFLFSRQATLLGPPSKTVAWASDMTEFVNANSPVETTLWQSLFGAPVGTLIWSSLIESRAQLGEVTMALMGNDGYHQRLEAAQDFASGIPAEDALREIVHTTGMAEQPPVGAAATGITATSANGRIGDAMEWGAQIAEMYAAVSGARVAFFADAYGSFGQVSWIALHDDLAAVDAGTTAANASEEYMAALQTSADLFIPGTGETRLSARIA